MEALQTLSAKKLLQGKGGGKTQGMELIWIEGQGLLIWASNCPSGKLLKTGMLKRAESGGNIIERRLKPDKKRGFKKEN